MCVRARARAACVCKSCVCAVGQHQGARELCRMRNDHTHVGFYLAVPAHRVTASDLSVLCSEVRAQATAAHDTAAVTRETMTSQKTTRDTLPFSIGLHEHRFPVRDAPAAPYEERLHAAPEGTTAHDERSAQQACLPDRLVVQRQRKSFRELRHRHHRAWIAGAAVRRRRRTTPSRQWPLARSVGCRAARSLRANAAPGCLGFNLKMPGTVLRSPSSRCTLGTPALRFDACTRQTRCPGRPPVSYAKSRWNACHP